MHEGQWYRLEVNAADQVGSTVVCRSSSGRRNTEDGVVISLSSWLNDIETRGISRLLPAS